MPFFILFVIYMLLVTCETVQGCEEGSGTVIFKTLPPPRHSLLQLAESLTEMGLPQADETAVLESVTSMSAVTGRASAQELPPPPPMKKRQLQEDQDARAL